MVLRISQYKTSNALLDLTKPVSADNATIQDILAFLKGENSLGLASIKLNNETKETNQYFSLLSQIAPNLVKETLAEYVIFPDVSGGVNEELIKSKAIPLAAVENNAIEEKFKTLTQNLSPEQVNSFKKATEVSVKIKNLEKDLDNYQNQKTSKEEKEKTLKIKEAEKEKLEQKLQSVASLLDIKKKVEESIAAKQTSAPNTANLEEIKEKRIAARSLQLVNGFKKEKRDSFNEPEAEKRSVRHTWLLALVALQVLLGLIYSVATASSTYLFFGIGSTVLLSFIFIWLQILKSQSKEADQFELASEEMPLNVQLDSSNSAEDKTIIDQAILNALLAEKESIDRTISNSLDNQAYETVQQSFDSIKLEVENLKKESSEPDKTISVDEYYKKRRELDILKIEKDNLEFSSGLETKPDADYINMLIAQNAQSSNPENLLLPFAIVSKNRTFDGLIETYQNIRQIIVLYENS